MNGLWATAGRHRQEHVARTTGTPKLFFPLLWDSNSARVRRATNLTTTENPLPCPINQKKFHQFPFLQPVPFNNFSEYKKKHILTKGNLADYIKHVGFVMKIVCRRSLPLPEPDIQGYFNCRLRSLPLPRLFQPFVLDRYNWQAVWTKINC